MRAIWRVVLLSVAIVLVASPAFAAKRERAVLVNGQGRTYLLIAPDKVSERLPLVIVFHGGGQSAERAQRYTRFDELAAGEKFVAVYPQGLDNNWNDGRASADLRGRVASSADDVDFTAEIIKQLSGEGIVDASHVFLTGASNGGMMALRAGCELDQRIAGIAPVVANLPLDWDCHAKSLPALFINGTDDEFVPYAGGQVAATKTRKNLGYVRSVEETIAIFQRMNGCSGVKDAKTLDEVGRDKTAVVITDYDCKSAPLKQIEVQGGGHTWPGSRTGILADWVLGNTSEEVSATAEIWSFFKALPGR